MAWNVPDQLKASRPRFAGLRQDPFHTPGQLMSRAARERHQQDARGIYALGQQMRHPVCQGTGFSRASSGDHQERRRVCLPCPICDRRALPVIEAAQMSRLVQHGRSPARLFRQDYPRKNNRGTDVFMAGPVVRPAHVCSHYVKFFVVTVYEKRVHPPVPVLRAGKFKAPPLLGRPRGFVELDLQRVDLAFRGILLAAGAKPQCLEAGGTPPFERA